MPQKSDLIELLAALFAPFVILPILILLARFLRRLRWLPQDITAFLLDPTYNRKKNLPHTNDPNIHMVRTLTSEKAHLKPFLIDDEFPSRIRLWIYDNLSPAAVRDHFLSSLPGRIWLILQTFFTIVAIVNYVVLTYKTIDLKTFNNIILVDGVLAFLFMADYIISFYAAEDRLKFFFSVASLIDLITIVPALVALFFSYEIITDQSILIYVLRLLRALRILRTYRLLSFAQTEERRQLILVLLTVLTFLFLAASIINIMETIPNIPQEKADLTRWHDSMWYMVVTMSTIGFGDVVPTNSYSRMTVLLLILALIVLIPGLSARISSIYYMHSPYHSAVYSKRKYHVIISGHVTFRTIVDFCREYFMTDPDGHIVILTPGAPSIMIRRLLRHPYYENRLTYLAGTPLSQSDLNRARAGEARALFLLSSTTTSASPSPLQQQFEGGGLLDEEDKQSTGADADILMMILSAKTAYPSLPVFGQVSDMRSKDISISCGCDRVLCVEELKMSLLARAAMYPAVMPFVTNVMHSYRNLALQRQKLYARSGADIGQGGWMKEYMYGSAQQVYSFTFPKTLTGARFADVVELMHRIYGITVFAVTRYSSSGTGSSSVSTQVSPQTTIEAPTAPPNVGSSLEPPPSSTVRFSFPNTQPASDPTATGNPTGGADYSSSSFHPGPGGMFIPPADYRIYPNDIGFCLALDPDIVELISHYRPPPPEPSSSTRPASATPPTPILQNRARPRTMSGLVKSGSRSLLPLFTDEVSPTTVAAATENVGSEGGGGVDTVKDGGAGDTEKQVDVDVNVDVEAGTEIKPQSEIVITENGDQSPSTIPDAASKDEDVEAGGLRPQPQHEKPGSSMASVSSSSSSISSLSSLSSLGHPGIQYGRHLRQQPEAPTEVNEGGERVELSVEKKDEERGNATGLGGAFFEPASSDNAANNAEVSSGEGEHQRQETKDSTATTLTARATTQPQPPSPQGTDHAGGTSESASKSYALDASTAAELRNHIILCGSTTSHGVHQFVSHIRKSSFSPSTSTSTTTTTTTKQNALVEEPAIVVLTETPIDVKTHNVWRNVFTKHPNVYYVRGIPQRASSLVRCGIERCKRIVILRGPPSSPSSSSDSSGGGGGGRGGGGDAAAAAEDVEYSLTDSQAMFVVKLIQSQWPRVSTLVELVNGRNVEYVSAKDTLWHSHARLSKRILDNPAIKPSDRLKLYTSRSRNLWLRRLNKPKAALGAGTGGPGATASDLMYKSSWSTSSTTQIFGITPFPEYHFDPSIAAGLIYVDSLVTSLLCQTFFRPYVGQVMQLIVSNVVQVPVAPELIGQ
ncbi:hypothetical protein HK102_001778, partial [Quaeritorhiza haematococci]